MGKRRRFLYIISEIVQTVNFTPAKTAECGFGEKSFLRRFFSKKRQTSSPGRDLAGVEPPDDPVDEETAPQQDHRP